MTQPCHKRQGSVTFPPALMKQVQLCPEAAPWQLTGYCHRRIEIHRKREAAVLVGLSDIGPL